MAPATQRQAPATQRHTDDRWMRRAVRLGQRGLGRTSPNPPVGAVLVKSGRCIGEGYHHAAGQPHAELNALHAATTSTRGATLYVTLEPCCHVGKTGPCADAIVDAGIARVVIGVRDPNPLVAGKGMARLRRRGVRVDVGILETDCARLSEAFRVFITTGRPFVTVKAALSLDGRMATRTGDSQWITGEAARRRVHRMRRQVDAVLIGRGTVETDNPRLTARMGERLAPRQPRPVILDSRARLSPTAQVFYHPRPPLIAVARDAPAGRVRRLEAAGAEVLRVPTTQAGISWPRLLTALAARDIVHVLIEGGPTVTTSALTAGIVNKVALFYAPLLIGGAAAPSVFDGLGTARLAKAARLTHTTRIQVGDDWLVEGYLD